MQQKVKRKRKKEPRNDAAKCVKLIDTLAASAASQSTVVPATTCKSAQLQKAPVSSISFEKMQEEGQQPPKQSGWE